MANVNKSFAYFVRVILLFACPLLYASDGGKNRLSSNELLSFEDVQTFATRFVQAINKADEAFIYDAFDVRKISLSAISGIRALNPDEENAFAEEKNEFLNKLVLESKTSWLSQGTEHGTSLHFITQVVSNNSTGFIARYNGPPGLGVNYFLFVLKKIQDKIKILDYYSYATVEYFSDNIRRNFLKILLSKNFKLKFSSPQTKMEAIFYSSLPQILDVEKLFQEQKFQEAKKILEALPRDIQKYRYVLFLKLQVAVFHSSKNIDELSPAFLEFKKAYPQDVSISFTETLFNLRKNNLTYAEKAFKEFSHHINAKDPYLDVLQSQLMFISPIISKEKKLTDIAERINKAIQDEPMLFEAYATKLYLYALFEQHKETLDVLVDIKNNFHVSPHGFIHLSQSSNLKKYFYSLPKAQRDKILYE